MKKFHIASIGLGLALFIYLVWEIGPGALWQEMRILGWGLAPFILLEGAAGIFYTLGWRACLSPVHQSFPFRRIWAINLAGNSISYFTPTATLGGEVIKGALLSDQGGAEAASGVMIGKLSYALSQLLFVVLGSLLILWRIDLPFAGMVAMLLGSAILGAGIGGFLILQKKGKLGAVVRWMVNHRVGGEMLRKLSAQITEVDLSLQLSYRERPWALPRSLAWHGVGMFFSIIKTWYFLRILTGGSFFGAAGIFFLGTWFDLLTFMIPLGVGVQEGSRVLAFRTLGFTLAAGLSYGVALRLEQLFWASVGLFIYMGLIGGRRGALAGVAGKANPLNQKIGR